jgi:uncharacterized protein YecE (DUF72 family)
MTTRHGTVRAGISGWTYKPWRGVFYPDDLTQMRELAFASGQFRSIEINGTFYSLQTPKSFARWAGETPDDFLFSVKAPRYITHMRRLKDVEKPLANFLGSGLLLLGPKLGPILWQFPPSFRFDAARIEPFLAQLPHDTKQAATMARDHDRKIAGRACTETDAKRVLRHAMEIRHDSFKTQEFIRLLRKYNVALVCADTVEWPRLMDVTSDFIYCRMHGSEVLYASGYDAKAVGQWAKRAALWAQGREPADATRIGGPAKARAKRDVFVYFDNDVKVRAPRDAHAFQKKVDAILARV